MKLTRRALVNEIRTLAAQLDMARQEVDRLTADVYELTEAPLQDRLVRALRHLEFSEADRERLEGEVAELHGRLAAFAERYPAYFEEGAA